MSSRDKKQQVELDFNRLVGFRNLTGSSDTDLKGKELSRVNSKVGAEGPPPAPPELSRLHSKIGTELT